MVFPENANDYVLLGRKLRPEEANSPVLQVEAAAVTAFMFVECLSLHSLPNRTYAATFPHPLTNALCLLNTFLFY